MQDHQRLEGLIWQETVFAGGYVGVDYGHSVQKHEMRWNAAYDDYLDSTEIPKYQVCTDAPTRKMLIGVPVAFLHVSLADVP